LSKEFNSIDKIESLYNIEDYAKEFMFRLEQAYKRTILMLETNKQKRNYDEYSLNFEIKIKIKKNDVGHKLDFKYAGPYKAESIGEKDNNFKYKKLKTKSA